jgi:HEAT repeat protein
MKATGLRFVTRLAAGAALVVGAIIAAPLARADGQQLKSALDDYAAGRYEDALKKLQEYVASNPGDDEVYGVLKTVDERVKLAALARGGESERLMRYLLDKAKPVVAAKKRDPERIKQLAEKAISGGIDERRKADLELATSSGEYAVPYLLPALGDSDPEKVVAAIFALQYIGAEAVLPLTAAMDASDARMRSQVAAVLGDIRDPRALPYLRRAVETDADPMVKQRAAAAIQKIQPQGQPKNAVQSFVTMGQRYLTNDPSVLSTGDEIANEWRWEGDGLVRYEVPVGLFGARLAERHAAAAMALAPKELSARSLLVRAILSQRIGAGLMGEKAPESLKDSWNVLVAQGYDPAAAALSDSLEQRDWDVAVEAARLVSQTYGKQELGGSSIGRALASPERRVQYAAAIAALRMSPGGPFDNSQQVPALGAQAASETAVRQVFLIDDQDPARNRMSQDLREAGYVVSDERNGYRAIARLKAAPTVDVVVVRADLGSAGVIPMEAWKDTIAIIDELQADLRTKNMKIVVVVGGESADVIAAKKQFLTAKYGDKIVDYVEEPLVTGAVLPKIEAVAAKADLNRERELAIKTAADAADAFATTNSHCTAWDFKVAIEPLANNAKDGASDEVKMNSIRALGNLRAGGSAALAEIVKGEAKEEMKVAAAKALGSVLSVVPPTADEIDVLIAAAKGGGVVGSAAMQSLGMARGLTPEQSQALYGTHKPEIGKKGE